MMEQIVEYRAYAAAKRLYDSATTGDARKRLPLTPMMNLVKHITFELVRKERDAE